MPPIKLNINSRDMDLVLQPTVTNSIFKGPHLFFSQAKNKKSLSTCFRKLLAGGRPGVAAHLGLFEESIILAPQIQEGVSTSTCKPSQTELLNTGACKEQHIFMLLYKQRNTEFIAASQQIVFQLSSKQQQKDSCPLGWEKALQEKERKSLHWFRVCWSRTQAPVSS